jgi:hypothetical protein
MTLERPEHEARKARPSKGVITDQWSRSPLSESGRHKCPRSTRITDHRLKGRSDREPLSPADAKKSGAPNCHPAVALLIRGLKPDPRRVRTGAPDRQSQGRQRSAHSSLSSSPSARGRPTCHTQEPARAASRADPIKGELPRPRSLANGTEPHLANPRERFHRRVSRPRANPYRTGHGRPLESPDNTSTRNPQSATRLMLVAETSPFVPRKDGEGAFETNRRARPNRLERAQAQGLNARLHLPRGTESR